MTLRLHQALAVSCLAFGSGCGTSPIPATTTGTSGGAGMSNAGSTVGGAGSASAGAGGSATSGGAGGTTNAGGGGGTAATAGTGGSVTGGSSATGGSGGSEVSSGGAAELPSCALPLVLEGVTKVACVGDSITEGYGASDPSKTYPSQLAAMLGELYDVENFGVGGTNMTKNGSSPYWNQGAFANAKSFLPNVVLLGLGTNDMGVGSYDALPDFPEDYAAMVDEFRALESKPLVFALIPIWVKDDNPGNGYTNARLAEVIAMIHDVAVAESLCVIDLNTPFVDHPELYYDGIHPNDAGYTLIASTICSAMGAGCQP